MIGARTERRGFPGGLRAQLLVGLCVLLGVAFTLIALVSLQVVRGHVRSASVTAVRHHARLLAGQLAVPGAQPGELAAELAARHDLTWAGALDGGELRGSSAPPDAVQRQLEELDETPAELTETTVTVDDISHILVAAPVEGAQMRAVAVSSLAPVERKVDETRQLLLVYLGLDALFILVIGYAFFTYLVVRPMRAIGVATERAARGDLASPITVLPANEFGQVGRRFNQMLAELRKNREELEERLAQLDRANQKLRETQDSLVRSEKLASVGQLAAGVAHEVGNPLSAISGYLELLHDDDLDDELTRDILERSQREVERIRVIIRDLLDFSRDDSDQAIEPLDLSVCVDEAVNLVEAQPRARSVDIVDELADDLPRVEAAGSQIVQILVNLLMNAVDAINQADVDDGEVRISAEADASTLALRVSDNGPGVDPEHAARIFDPFFTTKDPGEGTGLGLAISLRLMQRFGGDIRLESKIGEGTTFELVFPLADSN